MIRKIDEKSLPQARDQLLVKTATELKALGATVNTLAQKTLNIKQGFTEALDNLSKESVEHKSADDHPHYYNKTRLQLQLDPIVKTQTTLQESIDIAISKLGLADENLYKKIEDGEQTIRQDIKLITQKHLDMQKSLIKIKGETNKVSVTSRKYTDSELKKLAKVINTRISNIPFPQDFVLEEGENIKIDTIDRNGIRAYVINATVPDQKFIIRAGGGSGSSEGGGGGAVDSVNGQTGIVVLDAGDVGADVAGSAAAALASANSYTDTGLATKQNTLVSGTNIKTINTISLLGSGDITVGGGASFWDATVGSSGADYTTVAAAVTAGFSRLLLITSVTETSDVTIPAEFYIWGINRAIVWNTDTYRVIYTAGYRMTATNFTWAHGNVGTGNAVVTSGGDFISLNDVTIDNNASTANKSLFGNASANKNVYINNVIWQGNVTFFMYLSCGNAQVIQVNGIEVIGEGSSASYIMSGANTIEVDNMKVSGTFVNTTGACRTSGRITNLVMDMATPTNYGIIFEGGSITNAYCEGIFRFATQNTKATNIVFNNTLEFGQSSGQQVSIVQGYFTAAQTFTGNSGAIVNFTDSIFAANQTFQTIIHNHVNDYFSSTSSFTDTAYSNVSNCRFFGPHTGAGSNRTYTGCTFTANAHSITGDGHGFTGCKMESTVDTTSAADDLQFSNCDWTVAVTFSGDRYQIDNCRFRGNVTVASTAIQTRFNDCAFGGTFTDSGVNTRRDWINTVSTTNNTVTTLTTVAIPTNKTIILQSTIGGRRTGGSAGTAGDTASYIITGTYKNIAGTVTLVGALDVIANEDQAAWDGTMAVSGTNVIVTVAGDTNNNVDWYGVTNTTNI